VQKCKSAYGLCKGANVKTFSGPRSRPSGLWYGLSGTGAGAGGNSDSEPVPEPEHL